MINFAEINQSPFSLLNVVAFWQASDTKACAKKLSQILANNIDHGGRGISLTIYVGYCRSRHGNKYTKYEK